MKKIVTFILGLVAFTTLNAANTANVTLTLSANGGTEASNVKLRLDPSVTSVSGASWFQNLEAEGTVNIYAKVGANKYSQYKYNTLTNVPLEVVTNRRAATLQHYTITFSVLVDTETLYLTDLVLDPNNENPIAIVDGQSYEFDVNTTLHPNYVAGSNYVVEDRFIINYVPAPACDYSREGLVVNRYYTICLDRAIESANGASFWSLQYRNAQGSLAYLVEEQLPLVAGRPYIFQAEAEELCVELSGTPVNGPGYYGALKGTFAAMEQDDLDEASELAADSKIYLLFNNELWRVDYQENNSLAANRAYVVYNWFEVSEPNAAPVRRVRAIPMQGQTATGVENLNASEAPAKAIIDGKLYIIRGEQMFDATGRLVK